MKTTIRFAVCILLCSLLCVSAHAGPSIEVDASGGLGYVAGKNEYEIGGSIYSTDGQHGSLPFPISRLEFPIDMFFAKIEGNLNVTPDWKFTASLKRNFTDPGSDMKDSDWIFGGFGGNDTKDIYSTSKMNCDAWIFDINTRYRFFETVHGRGTVAGSKPDYRYHLFGGVGYMYQDYAYDVYDLDQFYPQAPFIPHDVVPGSVILYDLTFDIPYLMAGAEAVYGTSWKISLEGRASWFTHATDKDRHLLRDMVSKVDSDWDGTTYAGVLEVRYNFRPQWFVNLEGSLAYVRVDAGSYTEQPGLAPYTIDQKIRSDQASVFLTAGYEF